MSVVIRKVLPEEVAELKVISETSTETQRLTRMAKSSTRMSIPSSHQSHNFGTM